MATKTYINKCGIREKIFDNGDSILNCSFGVEELTSYAENGWVKITIAKRRETDEYGKSHYAYLDTFRPKKDGANTEPDAVEVSDDVPF